MSEENDPQQAPAPAAGKAKPRSFKPAGAAAQNPRAARKGPPPKGAPRTPASPGNDETPGNLGSVVIRNEFYRDGYRTILKLALVQAFIIVGMIGAMLFVIHVHQPENRYFATTEDGRLIPMVALSEPNLSTPALMTWVAQAATEVMTFGFNDYRRRLQEASRNFTKRGWDSFTKALEQSRIIEMVEANQQVVTAAPKGAPILESEGIVQGRYQWIVQLPLAVTYQSGSESTSDNLLITLVIVRLPRLENPSGVGIAQWIATYRGG